MSDPTWDAVDRYVTAKLHPSDPALEAALAANAAAGLPAHDVTLPQGKFLHLLARATGARRVLEVGTLGGYSTIWLARAVAPEGRVVTLEVDPGHAAVARENLAAAGVSAAVDLRVGPALETLARIAEEGGGPFDLVFIDADKPGNPAYLEWALRLSRPGTVIVVDNVVRGGTVLDEAASDANVQGARDLFDALAREPRVSATALQTVGGKGHDGFVLALVTA